MAAMVLSKLHGNVCLDGLTSPSRDVAIRLATDGPAIQIGDFYRRLSLNGITSLNAGSASALAALTATLSLKALKTLTASKARIPATHKTDAERSLAQTYCLTSNGVTTLSDGAAIVVGHLNVYAGAIAERTSSSRTVAKLVA